jgi:hypothetical protein
MTERILWEDKRSKLKETLMNSVLRANCGSFPPVKEWRVKRDGVVRFIPQNEFFSIS